MCELLLADDIVAIAHSASIPYRFGERMAALCEDAVDVECFGSPKPQREEWIRRGGRHGVRDQLAQLSKLSAQAHIFQHCGRGAWKKKGCAVVNQVA